MHIQFKSGFFKRCSVMALAFALLCLGQVGLQAQPSCSGKQPSRNNSAQWAGGASNLLTHWSKHQKENASWNDPDQYAQDAQHALGQEGNGAASHVIANGPNAGRMIFWSGAGSSGASSAGVFVVTNKDRKIISSFKPSSGKKYFDNQVAKDKSSGGPGHDELRSAGENDGDIWTIYTSAEC